MRRRLSVVSLSLLAVLPSLALAYQAEPPREALQVLRVDRYADDANAGSPRWAISTAHAAPGRYRIEIDAVGAAPSAIQPAAPLPAIQGPVQILGTPWARDGPYVASSASAYAPGTLPDACPAPQPSMVRAAWVAPTISPASLTATSGPELPRAGPSVMIRWPG